MRVCLIVILNNWSKHGFRHHSERKTSWCEKEHSNIMIIRDNYNDNFNEEHIDGHHM